MSICIKKAFLIHLPETAKPELSYLIVLPGSDGSVGLILFLVTNEGFGLQINTIDRWRKLNTILLYFCLCCVSKMYVLEQSFCVSNAPIKL